MHSFGKETNERIWQAHDFANFSNDSSGAIRTNCCYRSHAINPIFVGQIGSNILPTIRFKIDIDVWTLASIIWEEPVEVQIVFIRINSSETQTIGNGSVNYRSTPREENSVVSRPVA
jgi:hypothetical protein